MGKLLFVPISFVSREATDGLFPRKGKSPYNEMNLKRRKEGEEKGGERGHFTVDVLVGGYLLPIEQLLSTVWGRSCGRVTLFDTTLYLKRNRG